MAEPCASPRERSARPCVGEVLGIVVLLGVAIYFLGQSWRKWPDPIIDSGPQWYATWQVSLGAMPYHDFPWNYGPLSLFFNGLLFKIFGPGMMVLAWANLAVYAGIVVLGYFAFRLAWGKLGAFVALVVFISAFSFSLLNSVGNYNYVLPYANETTHGMLLLLVTALVGVRWSRKVSFRGALWLGLCGGTAAVLKPEFMLAAGMVGIAALVLRYWQHQPVRIAEFGLLALGVVLPTLAFAGWFARGESWKTALSDASQAWSVLVNQGVGQMPDESSYMGYDFLSRNAGFEAEAAFTGLLVVGAIWAAGWFLNRPWPPLLRFVAALAAAFLAFSVNMGGGFEIGPCFPGLIAVVFIVVMVEMSAEWRRTRRFERRTLMTLVLVLLAGTMLARMALRARINHFGFIQAALAGMVIAAMLMTRIPRWTGRGIWGQRLATAGILILLANCGSTIVTESYRNHRSQTQPVGFGPDRFYAFDARQDETGSVVNWCADKMRAAPANATLLVLPEGVMINYLSRHKRAMPEYQTNMVEEDYIKHMAQVRPDYVILIWGDQRDGGMPMFGVMGQPGEHIVNWLKSGYLLVDSHKESTKSALIVRRK